MLYNMITDDCRRKSNINAGFTIVELLVVIVVIGILAAITIVSYSGVSQQAIVASLKSDLANSNKQLGIFNVQNGRYPVTLNCSAIESSTNKCVRFSSGNLYTYTVDDISNPQSYELLLNKSGTYYRITDITSPASYTPIVASGGSTADSNGYRTHTFNSNSTLTVTTGGELYITISGGGGGGSGDSYDSSCNHGPGTAGGLSRVTYGSDNYTANGGAGGGCSAGAAGAVSIPVGFTNKTNPATGGAVNGGGGGGIDDAFQETVAGFDGGAGGRITGYVTVANSSTFSITVGSGGSGGGGNGYYGAVGLSGGNGIVTVRYPH